MNDELTDAREELVLFFFIHVKKKYMYYNGSYLMGDDEGLQGAGPLTICSDPRPPVLLPYCGRDAPTFFQRLTFLIARYVIHSDSFL